MVGVKKKKKEGGSFSVVWILKAYFFGFTLSCLNLAPLTGTPQICHRPGARVTVSGPSHSA